MAVFAARPDSSGARTEDGAHFPSPTNGDLSVLVPGYSVNNNGLLEFRVSPETGQAGQEFTVRAATLWLKADVRRPRTLRCNSTEIYVFKFISSISGSVKLSSQVCRMRRRFFFGFRRSNYLLKRSCLGRPGRAHSY